MIYIMAHKLRECVRTRCPDYLPEFDAFFAGNTGHYMNMLLMRRETYDACYLLKYEVFL